jgi:hypothetical protein
MANVPAQQKLEPARILPTADVLRSRTRTSQTGRPTFLQSRNSNLPEGQA